MNNLNFSQYQQQLNQFDELSNSEDMEFNWLAQLAGLNEEVGEVSRLIRRVTVRCQEYSDYDLANELGDVLAYLSLLTTSLGLDLNQVAQQNIDKLSFRHNNQVSNKPLAIFINGYTGAGKTTAADILEKELGVKHHHALNRHKRFMEEVYNLPIGALDTYETKQSLVPGQSITFQQLLVNQYHFWQSNDPEYNSRLLRVDLNELAANNTSFSLNAIRSEAEVNVVSDWITENHQRYDIYGLEIISAKSRKLSTDNAVDLLYYSLMAQYDNLAGVYHLQNNGTVSKLKNDLLNLFNGDFSISAAA